MFKIFRATAFIVFAASMFVSLATTTAHAQKPALTKSTDEPGRSPYFSSAYRYCANNGVCQISSFKPVPVGFLLVVTHASVVYVPATYSGHLDNLVSHNNRQMLSPVHICPRHLQSALIQWRALPSPSMWIQVPHQRSRSQIRRAVTSSTVQSPAIL